MSTTSICRHYAITRRALGFNKWQRAYREPPVPADDYVRNREKPN